MVNNPTVEQVKMASKFTHRQDNLSSYTSICLKCYRVVATRGRESELRADEAVHSCKIPVSGKQLASTYWGILCRTCADLVAFGTIPGQNSDPGTEDSGPGTIRCTKGHTHIYYPRDFGLFPAVTIIVDTVIRENVRVYKVINPSWADPLPQESSNRNRKNESGSPAEELDRNIMLSARRASEAPGKIARKAAKDRWTAWALNKLSAEQ
jgi:hypothetical protein